VITDNCVDFTLDFVINRFFMKLIRTLNMHVVSLIVRNSSILFYPVFNSPAVLRNL